MKGVLVEIQLPASCETSPTKAYNHVLVHYITRLLLTFTASYFFFHLDGHFSTFGKAAALIRPWQQNKFRRYNYFDFRHQSTVLGHNSNLCPHSSSPAPSTSIQQQSSAVTSTEPHQYLQFINSSIHPFNTTHNNRNIHDASQK